MRYTAVFEFPDHSLVSASCKSTWQGGKLCALQFSDALQELKLLHDAVKAIANGEGDAQQIAIQTLEEIQGSKF